MGSLALRRAALVVAASSLLTFLPATTAHAGCGDRYSFLAASANVSEGAGNATVTVAHSNTNCNDRRGATDSPQGNPCSVLVSTSNNTAASGSDYSSISQTVTFNCVGSSSQQVSVPIISDSIDEPDETFFVTLSSPSGSNPTLGQPSSETITILDDDVPQPPVIRFTTSTITVGEGAGNVNLGVLRDGATTGLVSADFDPNDGTATGDVDYTDDPGVVTFPSGNAFQTIPVPILDDSIDEPDETFTVVLSNPTGGASIGVPGTITITIVDDDGGSAPTIGFPTQGTTVPEDVGEVDVPVTCSENAAPSTGADLAREGTVDGEEATVEGLPNCTPAPQSTLVVTIIDDDNVEAGDTIVLVLSNPTGGATIAPFDTFTITIAPSDVQPDAEISRFKDRLYRGRGIINDDGTNQTIGGNATVNDDALVRWIRVRHNAPGLVPINIKRNTPDDVIIKLFIVLENGDLINITQPSINGHPVQIAEGDFLQLKLKLSWERRMPVDTTRNILITSRRSSDVLKKDVVRARLVYRS